VTAACPTPTPLITTSNRQTQANARIAGGAEWILLAATYGWVMAARGEPDRAREMLSWIQQSATSEGYLPEQLQNHVQSPYMLNHWKHKWGETATLLLWSHAMHIVLTDVLGGL